MLACLSPEYIESPYCAWEFNEYRKHELQAGVVGEGVAPIYFVTHKMGAVLGLKAFAVTIAGGFGDVRGAIAGGLALGVIETFGAAYVSVVYKDAFAFLLLILFLLFRPQGIFGEKVAEKA